MSSRAQQTPLELDSFVSATSYSDLLRGRPEKSDDVSGPVWESATHCLISAGLRALSMCRVGFATDLVLATSAFMLYAYYMDDKADDLSTPVTVVLEEHGLTAPLGVLRSVIREWFLTAYDPTVVASDRIDAVWTPLYDGDPAAYAFSVYRDSPIPYLANDSSLSEAAQWLSGSMTFARLPGAPDYVQLPLGGVQVHPLTPKTLPAPSTLATLKNDRRYAAAFVQIFGVPPTTEQLVTFVESDQSPDPMVYWPPGHPIHAAYDPQ